MDYLDINRIAWNERVEPHFVSEFYAVSQFINGLSSLKEIELAILPPLEGKTLLHLQCHFGQDSISLSRMGALVTGIDFSDKAIDQARILASQCNSGTQFICTDVYNVPAEVPGQFDIVFTSYGTIGWLPDLGNWASVISQKLKPGGQFIIADFHPVIWMFDTHFSYVQYSYFNKGPIIESESGTYADKNAPITRQTIGWNHSFGEIIEALHSHGLSILQFNEFDYSPYNCFENMYEYERGKFRINTLGDKVPYCYSILAKKN
ncbi:MAG: class I SAM-dependent methyltransferase [Saprospiraceae bacterium]